MARDRSWRFTPEGRVLREPDGLDIGRVEECQPQRWTAWPNPESPIYHREEDAPREFTSRDKAAEALYRISGPAVAHLNRIER